VQISKQCRISISGKSLSETLFGVISSWKVSCVGLCFERKTEKIEEKVPMSFKEKNSFEKRVALAQKIFEVHKDRVPVIVEKRAGTLLPDIDKPK
jgi:hypothetical protein